MENEIIEIYEHNDQTLELSLVTEEEIPEALEVVRDTFERTKNRKCKVFRLESDEKMRSYMTDKGFAVKAMRYGEMVAVFIVQTEGVDRILAETGIELSEEERKSAALIYSWYPMTYIRNGEGLPVRLINKMMRAAEKVMWDRGIHYAAGIERSGLTRAQGTFGRSKYKEKGDFQKENGEMQTLFWKNLKKVESRFLDGDDDWPWFWIEQAEEQEGSEIYNFMQRIYEGIPDKSWFSMDKEEEILRYMSTAGFAVKAEAPMGRHEYELAGIFIARISELGEDNLGKYLNLNEEELTRVAHMEIAMVDEEFRGKGLQKSLMEIAEEHLKFLGYRWLMGTAHPENVYSVHNFQKLGYEIVAEDIKYGGLPRYIFCKKIALADDEKIRIQIVEKEDIPKVLDFIDEIYEEMPDKSWLTKDSRENMTRYMTTSGFALKAEACNEKGEHELAAIFVSRTSGLGDENLGIYMNLDKEQLEQVAHMELSMVGKNYRGKGLQKKLMENAEKRLKAMGYCWLMGKAHPENIYSANNYQRLGYETVAEIKMSDGSPRSIFGKKIQ